MAPFIFTCPKTGLNVQHSSDDDDEDAPVTEYKALICPACTRVHFINLNTRKVFGQDTE